MLDHFIQRNRIQINTIIYIICLISQANRYTLQIVRRKDTPEIKKYNALIEIFNIYLNVGFFTMHS